MRPVLAFLAIAIGCGPAVPATDRARDEARCPSFAEGREVGRVQAAVLDEISGVVASREQEDVLWVHNDSGAGASLFAIDVSGAFLGHWTIEGAPAIDWEDLTIESVPGGPDRLWIGDVGDNGARDHSIPPRTSVSVIRIEEPHVDRDRAPITETRSVFDEIVLRFPDQPHDTEAISIDPTTGDLYVFAKENRGGSDVYRVAAPIPDRAEVVLEQVATIDAGGMVTAADISPDGRELLVRSYRSVLHWARPDDETWARALDRVPRDIPHHPEPQGEAIAFTPDGAGFLTISEGAGAPVWLYERACDD